MSEATEATEATDKRIKCEVYSRIVGYIRPVQQWNKGKRQEWAERKTYKPAGRVVEEG